VFPLVDCLCEIRTAINMPCASHPVLLYFILLAFFHRFIFVFLRWQMDCLPLSASSMLHQFCFSRAKCSACWLMYRQMEHSSLVFSLPE
jgi:hypothetical protein